MTVLTSVGVPVCICFATHYFYGPLLSHLDGHVFHTNSMLALSYM